MLRLRVELWAIGGMFIAQVLAPARDLEFIGEQSLPPGVVYEKMRIGGLSGIAYDAKRDVYFLASDTKDRGGSQIFLAKIPVNESGIGAIEWTGLFTLKNSEGTPRAALDAEGIALENRGRLLVSFEGNRSTPSGIACFGRKSGKERFQLPLPDVFATGDKTGIQDNHGLESLSTAGPGRRWLFTTSESPLFQDATPGPDPYRGPIRLLRYDLKPEKIATPEQRAYLMETDAVYTSVPDVLALDERRLLVLERQLVNSQPPRARRIRVYEVDFDQKSATDVAPLNSLRGAKIRPLKKNLRFDSDRTPIPHLDNIEAMSLGPAIGSDRSIVLVSDDNFNKTQRTQFLLLRLKE